MVLYVKNKLISLGGSSFVIDENDENVFEIKGKLFSPTHKKFIYDMQGNKLFTVRNKYWHFFTKKAFIFDKDGQKYCKIKERFFGRTTDIVDCEDELILKDNGLGKCVSIFKNGKEIGNWGINFDLMRDSYKLEVLDETETSLLVALVIAIDNIRDNRRK